MIYRKLGRTGLSVSQVGLGCEHLQGKPFETVDAVVGAALEGGMNIIDVFMSEPQVRSDIGRALGAKRGQVYIQGHIGAIWRDGQYARSRDVGECREGVRDFLERFRTDYIDLGMLHFIDTKEDFDRAFNGEYLDYALSLKKSGAVRFLGASSHDPATAKLIAASGAVDMLMFSVNPAFDLLPAGTDIGALFKDGTYAERRFEIDPARAELYAFCESRGVGITVMKTLAAGRLLSAAASPFGVALSPYQCMSYALDRPAVASVLIGAATAEQARQAAAYAPEDYTVISRGSASAMRGRCMYCNHCLPCAAGIDIAAVTKYLDMARQGEGATAGEHYAALGASGGDCVGCGSCEENCPFGVKIRENMAAAAETFGK